MPDPVLSGFNPSFWADIDRLNDWSPAEAAVAYSMTGLSVFPVWWVGPGSTPESYACACPDGQAGVCSEPGKHPLVKWKTEATPDTAQVREWWRRWPDAGVGLALRDQLVVIDLDQHEADDGYLTDGADSLAKWAQDVEVEVPGGPSVRSGGGGQHLFLGADSDTASVRNRTGWLPAVDLRANGGYVLLPPTLHLSGKRYRWETKGLPPLAGPRLGGFMATARIGGAGGGGGGEYAGNLDEDQKDGVPAGRRDAFFNTRAWQMRRDGADKSAALETLKTIWGRVEQPVGNVFPWDKVVAKVERIWVEVEVSDTAGLVEQVAQSGLGSLISLEDRRPKPFFVEDLSGFHGSGGGGGGDGGAPSIRYKQNERFTETAAARIYTALNLGLHVKVVKGEWFRWVDRWLEDPDGSDARRVGMARVVAFYEGQRDAVAGDEEAANRIEKWVHRLETRATCTAILSNVGNDLSWCVDQADLDANRSDLQLPGRVWTGAVDGGSTRRAEPQDLMTKCTNVDLDPKLDRPECPLWEAHLASMCAYASGERNLEKEQFLQRWVGYCLTGHMTEQRFLFICGTAGSGKSVFVETMAWVLGDYAANISKVVLTGDESTHPTVRMPLIGARWAYVGEELDQKAINVSTFKSLVTGETFTARGMGQDLQTFRATAKFVLEGNERFRVDDKTDGFWRRMILLMIEHAVPIQDRGQMDYTARLRAEGPGILAWALDGLQEWYRTGLAVPDQMHADSADYRDDEDTVAQFVDENFEMVPEDGPARLASKEVYDRYDAWCRGSGYKPLGAQRLGNALVDRFGFERGAKNERVYLLGRGKSRVLYGRPMTSEWAPSE